MSWNDICLLYNSITLLIHACSPVCSEPHISLHSSALGLASSIWCTSELSCSHWVSSSWFQIIFLFSQDYFEFQFCLWKCCSDLSKFTTENFIEAKIYHIFTVCPLSESHISKPFYIWLTVSPVPGTTRNTSSMQWVYGHSLRVGMSNPQPTGHMQPGPTHTATSLCPSPSWRLWGSAQPHSTNWTAVHYESHLDRNVDLRSAQCCANSSDDK